MKRGIYIKKILLILLIILLFPIIGFSQESDSLGINLASVEYWSRAWTFVDRMKNAGNWGVQDAGGFGEQSAGISTVPPEFLDSYGYPTEIPFDIDGSGPLVPQIVSTLLYVGDTNYPAGEYSLIFEGEGTIRISYDGSGVFSVPGVMHHFTVNPSISGIQLSIESSSAADPIRNIRVIMPGFEDTYEEQIFHPLFLDRLRGFNIIRFMDWGKTNDSSLISWDDRTTLNHYSQAVEHGVAVEYMIELANRLSADPWICIPHQADDNFIRQMALMIRQNLNTDRKVYIEYSNELWNWGFSQTSYVEQMGNTLGFAIPGLNYNTHRSSQIFEIFEEVFGGNDSLVRVIAAQAANVWTSDQLLNGFQNPAINNTSTNADVLAIAPYFGYAIASEIVSNNEVSSISVDEIVNRARVSIYTDTAPWTRDSKVVADRYNVPLIAYEGGQHLVAGGGAENIQELTDKLVAANKHPGMKDVYLEMFNVWFQNGGLDFVAYNNVESYGKYGCWGMLEYQNSPLTDAPKYDAIRQILNGNTDITFKPLVPFNIRVKD